MDEIDFGYQVVLSCDPRARVELIMWLGAQIGYEFVNGDRIESIEHFQILEHFNAEYSCVAIARVVRADRVPREVG